MAIYFIGNEGDTFDSFNGSTTTNSLVALSGIARAGVSFTGFGQVGQTNFTPLTEGWIHFVAHKLDNIAFNAFAAIFALRNAEGVSVFELQAFGSQTGLYYSVQGGGPVGLGGGGTIDIQFKIAASGGYIRLYYNGIAVLNYTSSTLFSSGTQSVSNFYVRGCSFSGVDRTCIFGQFLVSDASTIGAKIYTNPLTVTATNQWTGTPTNVTGTTYAGTTNAISETTPDDKIRFDAADLPTLGASEFIGGVGIGASALAEIGTSVPKIQGSVFNGTTDTLVGSAVTKNSTFSGTNIIMNTDPNTSTSWTQSGFNAAQFSLVAKA